MDGQQNSVRIWEIASGKEVSLGGGHRGSITALVVTPDGKTAVSRGGDKIIRWEVATGTTISAETSRSPTVRIATVTVTAASAETRKL